MMTNDPAYLVLHAMADRGVSKAELARRLDLSPAAVSQMLHPGRNWTMKTLGRCLDALDYQLVVEASNGSGTSKQRVQYVYPRHTAGKH